MSGLDLVNRSILCLRERVGSHFTPLVGIVGGSGLKDLAQILSNPGMISYREIDGFTLPSVEGHAGELYHGTIADVPVALLSGRVHLYEEGCTPRQVVHAVRTLVLMGCKTIILTNAAGGINAEFRVGDFMMLADHLNLTGQNPLVGSNDFPGPRFPDMTRVYDPRIRQVLRRGLELEGARTHLGVYAGLVGPSYETPAEIRLLRGFGADAVGMSTVLEAIAVRHLGALVGAISVITNAAAGMSDQALDHAEVQAAGTKAIPRLIAALQYAIPERHRYISGS